MSLSDKSCNDFGYIIRADKIYDDYFKEKDVKESLKIFIEELQTICDKVGVLSMADIKWNSIEIFGEDITPFHGSGKQ